METERIALRQRERDRLRVLHEIKRRQITQLEAARRLKISDRHIRRLLVERGKRGDRAVIHRLRGRRSNRRLAARLELKILTQVWQRYADFGPTLAAEHLVQEGLAVSRETLRKWMEVACLASDRDRCTSPRYKLWSFCTRRTRLVRARGANAGGGACGGDICTGEVFSPLRSRPIRSGLRADLVLVEGDRQRICFPSADIGLEAWDPSAAR